MDAPQLLLLPALDDEQHPQEDVKQHQRPLQLERSKGMKTRMKAKTPTRRPASSLGRRGSSKLVSMMDQLAHLQLGGAEEDDEPGTTRKGRRIGNRKKKQQELGILDTLKRLREQGKEQGRDGPEPEEVQVAHGVPAVKGGHLAPQVSNVPVIKVSKVANEIASGGSTRQGECSSSSSSSSSASSTTTSTEQQQQQPAGTTQDAKME